MHRLVKNGKIQASKATSNQTKTKPLIFVGCEITKTVLNNIGHWNIRNSINKKIELTKLLLVFNKKNT